MFFFNYVVYNGDMLTAPFLNIKTNVLKWVANDKKIKFYYFIKEVEMLGLAH